MVLITPPEVVLRGASLGAGSGLRVAIITSGRVRGCSNSSPGAPNSPK